MTLGQFLLRLLAPMAEKQRQETRGLRACVRANAEDLNRTLMLDGKRIAQMLSDERESARKG